MESLRQLLFSLGTSAQSRFEIPNVGPSKPTGWIALQLCQCLLESGLVHRDGLSAMSQSSLRITEVEPKQVTGRLQRYRFAVVTYRFAIALLISQDDTQVMQCNRTLAY